MDGTTTVRCGGLLNVSINRRVYLALHKVALHCHSCHEKGRAMQ